MARPSHKQYKTADVLRVLSDASPEGLTIGDIRDALFKDLPPMYSRPVWEQVRWTLKTLIEQGVIVKTGLTYQLTEKGKQINVKG
jgi:predicted transcriptional regulator